MALGTTRSFAKKTHTKREYSNTSTSLMEINKLKSTHNKHLNMTTVGLRQKTLYNSSWIL